MKRTVMCGDQVTVDFHCKGKCAIAIGVRGSFHPGDDHRVVVALLSSGDARRIASALIAHADEKDGGAKKKRRRKGHGLPA